MGSKPARVTTKTSYVRKAAGNHLIKPTSLEKPSALSLVSATPKMEYETQLKNVAHNLDGSD